MYIISNHYKSHLCGWNDLYLPGKTAHWTGSWGRLAAHVFSQSCPYELKLPPSCCGCCKPSGCGPRFSPSYPNRQPTGLCQFCLIPGICPSLSFYFYQPHTNLHVLLSSLALQSSSSLSIRAILAKQTLPTILDLGQACLPSPSFLVSFSPTSHYTDPLLVSEACPHVESSCVLSFALSTLPLPSPTSMALTLLVPVTLHQWIYFNFLRGSEWGWEIYIFTSSLHPMILMLMVYQFSSVQSLSRVWLFATPWTTARQASLSITNSRNPPELMSIELVMLSNHLILCHPLLLLSSSFPASGSFPISPLFASGGQSFGVSALISVLLVNTQDWSPLGWTGLISLQSKGLSRVFSNTTVQKHQFFGLYLDGKHKGSFLLCSYSSRQFFEKCLQKRSPLWAMATEKPNEVQDFLCPW